MRFASAMASWMAVTAPSPALGFSLWHADVIIICFVVVVVVDVEISIVCMHGYRERDRALY